VLTAQDEAQHVDIDVEAVDRAVESAIAVGRPVGLRVLGYGEITLVIGWPADAPVAAIKRLPAFSDRRGFDAYASLLDRYIAALRARGAGVVHTRLLSQPGPLGTVRGYIVQPYVPHDLHLESLLRQADTEQAERLVARLVDVVFACVDERVGLDAQVANWTVDRGALHCFDVSTPMLRGPDGRQELDFSTFLSIYPWAVRPLLSRIAPGVMAQYHDARTVLLDVASNLHKDGLVRVLPVLIDLANERLTAPLSVEEVLRYFRRDKLLWATLQRLRLADRAWQRRVRHRPYPFLLPGRYRYGPPRPHVRHMR
jgi:hypothetical protein